MVRIWEGGFGLGIWGGGFVLGFWDGGFGLGFWDGGFLLGIPRRQQFITPPRPTELSRKTGADWGRVGGSPTADFSFFVNPGVPRCFLLQI